MPPQKKKIQPQKNKKFLFFVIFWSFSPKKQIQFFLLFHRIYFIEDKINLIFA
jgi:hypothetical protein